MAKITGKQCKTARSLLKWNVHDLANHVKNLQARRIEVFEHGHAQLMEWENAELAKAFKKAGILFKADLEVVLDTNFSQHDSQQGLFRPDDGARIVVNADMTVASDTTASENATGEITSKDDDKRKEDKSAIN